MTTSCRGDRGVAVLTVAVAMSVLMVATALSVDVGRLLVRSRELQRVADVAALDASRILALVPEDDTALPTVAAAAARSARRNGLDLEPGAVDIGHWSEGRWEPVRPGDPTWPPSAVRVEAAGHISWMFVPGGSDPTRSAIGSAEPVAGIAAGGTLASVSTSESELLGPAMSALLGSSSHAELSAISWQGLADLSVGLEDVAIAAGYGSSSEYLAAEIAVADHLRFIASALGSSGLVEAAADLEALADAAHAGVGLPAVRVADIVTVSGGAQFATRTHLAVMDLVQALLLLANSDGPQVQFETTVDVGRVSDVQVTASIVEPPQIAFGPTGTQARSAQVDVAVDVTVDLAEPLEHALGSLIASLLGPHLESLGELHLQMSAEGAQTIGTITAIGCSGLEGSPASVAVEGETRLATLSMSLLGTEVAPAVPTGGGQLVFTAPFGWSSRQPVPSTGLHLVHTFESALDATIDARLAGLALDGLLDPVRQAMSTIVAPMLNPVVSQVISPTLSALGIELASGEIAALGTECGAPRLVD